MQKANGDTFQNHLWAFLKTFFETNAKGCKLNMLYSKRICVPGEQPQGGAGGGTVRAAQDEAV